jgi:hypothetical protein
MPLKIFGPWSVRYLLWLRLSFLSLDSWPNSSGILSTQLSCRSNVVKPETRTRHKCFYFLFTRHSFIASFQKSLPLTPDTILWAHFWMIPYLRGMFLFLFTRQNFIASFQKGKIVLETTVLFALLVSFKRCCQTQGIVYWATHQCHLASNLLSHLSTYIT